MANTPPLFAHIQVLESPYLADGELWWAAPDKVWIGMRPLTELEKAGREAEMIVREGLSDVLFWLGESVNNQPTGAELKAAFKRWAEEEDLRNS